MATPEATSTWSSSQDEVSGDDVERLRDRIEAWTGNTAQIIALTPADVRRLRRAKEPIVATWDRELAVICGDRGAIRAHR